LPILLFNNTRYEAWAKFWFEKGKTGRGLCKITYEGKEYASATAATTITGYQVKGGYGGNMKVKKVPSR